MLGIDWYDHMVHFYRRKHIDMNYIINPMMEIPKFSYLNLNIYKGFKLIWIVMLLDRGQ
jgi:hypothetical protein